jgi:hypothetical protein
MRILWGFSLILLFNVQNISAFNNNSGHNVNTDSSSVMIFSKLEDTLYTFQPFYLEVNLNTQMGYLHSRDGSVKPFGISSGTDKLKEGINTKEGLYVIQSKMSKWYSRQFDSTLMLNWMGFHFGTGFHALRSSRYYKYLGKKKSSHGCVRISRAMAQFLFDTVNIGTPVLVHKGSKLVTIAFSDSTRQHVHYSRRELQNEVALREKLIYTGRYYVSGIDVVIDKNNVGHSGLPLGNPLNSSKKNIIKSPFAFVQSVIPQTKGITKLPQKSLWKQYHMRLASI